MKDFVVDVDIVVSKQFRVKAENEDGARDMVSKMIDNLPYEHIRNYNAYVGHEVIDAYEDK